ncbi:2-dehydro-3-deoxyglucarate aldolase [Rasamsonia emersonii CBS 393.64]|uniref:2-dehydro-3-deoxyglucarate aldolase n=1 Tax=Rasamsonia emersonii (strain ATCC 16479 / CBS 393.64 / IMI 116815) TaxID=1408163 RepID=A0A0F4Z3N2_RASE3|nr:2-dehydro-3-deoxyglucarate aldolase [Rasamsonia emersonii CBS 393.64]KKA24960.1 2-dehydro-3-deoxyglucarate aldolase [Rasamsonia emersonii CBS 393.64]
MQAANRLLQALRTGSGVSFGAWQMLPGANHARFMARSGYDWICVDTEHGNIAGEKQARGNEEYWQMHEAVAAIAACGVSPIVRIAANEAWMVKRALDTGAHGIVVPLLYTADDARKLVESAKFPPAGRRGFGSPFAMGPTGGVSQFEYLQTANDSLLTIVQIETKEALENVEEIAKVPGIDVLFVGPWDLGNNIGRPVQGEFHEDLNAAIERIRKAAVDNGKKAGIYCVGGEAARKYAEQGFHMISVVADAVALPTFLSNALETAKGGKSGAAVPTY